MSKANNREKGSLTVEASISLTLFVFFILFLLNFARIYRAQSIISHAVIQAVDAMALESYLREAAYERDSASIGFWANYLTGEEGLAPGSLDSLRGANMTQLAKEKFRAAISDTNANADNTLKKLGVKDGLAGVSFPVAVLDQVSGDVILGARYTAKMQFPLFGASELTMSKTAKAKTFGEVRYNISGTSNNPNWGSVTGGGRYQSGQTVNVSAQPLPGYRFVQWSDGNTDPNRNFVISHDMEIHAIFEPVGVSIRITGGLTGSESTTFTAVTDPADAQVTWSVSNSSILDMSQIGHSCTVSAVGTNNSYRHIEIFYENRTWNDYMPVSLPNTVTLTAKAELNGASSTASVEIVTLPAYRIESFFYQKTGGTRNFFNSRLSNEFNEKKTVKPSGMQDYYSKIQGCWHRTAYVTPAEWESLTRLPPRQLSGGSQSGYNMTGYNGTNAEEARMFRFSDMELPFFYKSRVGSGDYFIKEIRR